MVALISIAAVLTLHGRIPPPRPVTADTDSAVAAVRADARDAADTLRLHDPALGHAQIRARFDSAMAGLDALPATATRAQAIVAWAKAIAALHDGHTQLRLADDPHVAFHQLPIRAYWFDDGLYVVAVRPGLERLLGARIDRIGGLAVDTVIARMRPIIHGDNEMTIRSVLPSRLVLAEVLESVGAASSDTSVTLTMRSPDGRAGLVTLAARVRPDDPTWIRARERLASVPLYLRRVSQPYWFTYLDATSTMYVQYNSVEDDADEPFARFCERLFRAIDSTNARRLVLDIRNNNGGDNTLLRPLELGLIRSPLNAPERMYVVTGRLTFSAAVNLAADLEKWTEATFVGEPTGAPANHYGETQHVNLPRTGMLLLYSSLYYQSVGNPRDARPWIAPRIAVPVLSKNYFSGRDAVLDTVLSRPIR